MNLMRVKQKLIKKDFNGIDIYYLGYEHQKKISKCNVINSMNLLYLKMTDMSGQFEKGKDDVWYLVISDDEDVFKKLVDIFKSSKNKITETTWSVVEYLCDGCYNIMQRSNDFKNIAIADIEKSAYRIY